jgi:hypothetical protein
MRRRMGHLLGERDAAAIISDLKITPAMIQAGVDILLFFDPEMSDPADYAKKIYRAMVEISHSDP